MKPLSQQPQYVEAATEIQTLSAALGKVQARIAEIEALMRTTVPDPAAGHVADALKFAETGQVRQPVLASGLHDEHALLRQQREALEHAIKARQQAQLQLVSLLSAEVSAAEEPAHRKLAARYLKKLQELDALYEEEMALVRSIESEGYAAQFRNYIRWPHIGMLRWRGESALWSHFNDLKHYAKD